LTRVAVDAGIDGGTRGRLAAALALSALLHAALVVMVQAGLPSTPTTAATPIEARIEALEQPVVAQASSPAPALSLTQEAESAVAGFRAASPLTPEREAPAAASTVAAPSNEQTANRVTPLASLAATPDYYAITALDRPPVPLTRPDACYPYGATGEVIYELLIDEAGAVNRATVLAVKPTGLFTAAAAELCSALRFSPAIKDGRAVRSRVRFVVGPTN